MFGSSLQTRREAGDFSALADRVKAGNVPALSRLITLLENQNPSGIAVLRLLGSGPHHAAVIGITGYPGAGKSTLVAQLVAAYRRSGMKVGVLAVDISSSVTGGALLGDRIRMQKHTLDQNDLVPSRPQHHRCVAGRAGKPTVMSSGGHAPDIDIRIMATRGHHGGLARAAGDATVVLGAAGYEVILIETIGVGQNEVEVMDVASTVVAVVAPGFGDEVQAMKAGLLEAAPIVVVNKGDLAGADTTLRDLRDWCSTVLRTVATTGEGIPELIAAIAEHQRLRDLQGASARLIRKGAGF